MAGRARSRPPARVAVVTGGSGGVGRATAERLAAAGMAVAVQYFGHPDAAAEVVAAVQKSGGRAMAVEGDVGDETDTRDLFERTEEAFGGIDVVVNAAGIMLLGPLAEMDLDDFDRMHRTNVRGAFVVSQQAARRVRQGGAIIHFSTSVVRLAQPTYAAYAATKGAVEAMTLILAKELRGRDVTVNSVAPGPTATRVLLDDKSDEAVDQLAQQTPLERLGRPNDIAEVVAFLAGPGRWVNGQTVHANGGAV